MENDRTVLIDASTAFRVNDDWVYGFPELSKEQRAALTKAKRISNPGCYPTGFIGLTRPLTPIPSPVVMPRLAVRCGRSPRRRVVALMSVLDALTSTRAAPDLAGEALAPTPFPGARWPHGLSHRQGHASPPRDLRRP